MSVASPEAVVSAAVLVAAYSEASDALKEQAGTLAEAAWTTFEGWYTASAVAAMANEWAEASFAAQQAATGLSQQYAANMLESMGVAAPGRFPPYRPIRNGVDLRLVHRRPAEAYKRAIATGSTHEEALVIAGLRAANLAVTDLSTRERQDTQDVLAEAGIVSYRRVIRPELSKTGTCGMCIVAADQKYKTGDLMPLHGNCNCVVVPILGDVDPGYDMNQEDLQALYDAAGGSNIQDLLKTKYTVQMHGELGPILTKDGDRFRGPDRVALEDDPERAARMLDQMLPVLADLQRRQRAGKDVSGPLAYQVQQVARLRRIVTGA